MSATVGIVRIGRKRPGFDQQWNETMTQACLGALAELGEQCVGAEAPVADDESILTLLARIRESGADALLVLQPSMGNGQLALTLAQNWPGPIILWATPEREDSALVSSCGLVAQHLWASILRQADHPFEFIAGHADNPQVRAQLAKAIGLSRAVHGLKHAKIGMVGTHAPGFLDLAVDPFVLRRDIGTQVHPLSLPQFMDRVVAIAHDDARADAENFSNLKVPGEDVISQADLILSSQYVLAMKQLIAEERLDALVLQEWPEMPNVLGQWPYLAMSRLSDEGVVVAMEGDTDGALTCLAGKLAGTGIGFITDWLEHEQRIIHFWHPGMAPISMLHAIGSESGPRLAQHFNIVRPLVIDGQFRAGETVTIARFWKCDGQYNATAFEGITVAPRRLVTGNAAHVQVQFDVPSHFDTLIHEGLPHHVALFYGNHQNQFRALSRALRLKWIDQ